MNSRAQGARNFLLGLIAVCTMSLLGGCSAIQGYPADPEDTDATLQRLKVYFDSKYDDQYNNTTDATAREQLRDTVVLNRVHAYDLEFDDFERSLYGNGNGITTGSDLVVLALSGLGATTGSSAAKSALAAASGGIVGAQGAVNKDLYYQKTLPALLAQMEANRAKAKLPIVTGLSQADSKYPLASAESDLEALKMAGSIPAAIANITQQANNANDAAQSQISSIKFGGNLPSSLRIKAWLYPGGKDTDAQGNLVAPVSANLTALVNWMNADKTDSQLQQIPWENLVDGDSPQMESDRQRLITALHIP